MPAKATFVSNRSKVSAHLQPGPDNNTLARTLEFSFNKQSAGVAVWYQLPLQLAWRLPEDLGGQLIPRQACTLAAPFRLAHQLRCVASRRLTSTAAAGLATEAAAAVRDSASSYASLPAAAGTNAAMQPVQQQQQQQQEQLLHFSIAAITRQGYAPGYKQHNQDTCMVVQPYLHEGHALLGVADGHGVEGHLVVDFIRNKLPSVLLGKLLMGYSTPAALSHTFEEVDDLMCSTGGMDVNSSGSTLLVSLLQGRQLTTAWVGDSRAVVGYRAGPRSRWGVRALSQDHKPDLEAERRRITQLGGRVEPAKNSRGQLVGPHRVWLPELDYPGLAMSRALGDMVVKPLGVTASPDIATYKVSPQDRFVVLATDGVWEYLTNEQVVQLVGDVLEGSAAASDADTQHDGTRHHHSAQRRQHAGHHGLHTAATPHGPPRLLKSPLLPSLTPATGTSGGQSPSASGTSSLTRSSSSSMSSLASSVELSEEQPEAWTDDAPVVRACAALVETARDSWVQRHRGQYVDDISAVVIAFHDDA